MGGGRKPSDRRTEVGMIAMGLVQERAPISKLLRPHRRALKHHHVISCLMCTTPEKGSALVCYSITSRRATTLPTRGQYGGTYGLARLCRTRCQAVAPEAVHSRRYSEIRLCAPVMAIPSMDSPALIFHSIQSALLQALSLCYESSSLSLPESTIGGA